jgi:hypothetical protein
MRYGKLYDRRADTLIRSRFIGLVALRVVKNAIDHCNARNTTCSDRDGATDLPALTNLTLPKINVVGKLVIRSLMITGALSRFTLAAPPERDCMVVGSSLSKNSEMQV